MQAGLGAYIPGLVSEAMVRQRDSHYSNLDSHYSLHQHEVQQHSIFPAIVSPVMQHELHLPQSPSWKGDSVRRGTLGQRHQRRHYGKPMACLSCKQRHIACDVLPDNMPDIHMSNTTCLYVH